MPVQRIGETWAAAMVADGAAPSKPNAGKGNGFYAGTAAKADRLAEAHLGLAGPED